MKTNNEKHTTTGDIFAAISGRVNDQNSRLEAFVCGAQENAPYATTRRRNERHFRIPTEFKGLTFGFTSRRCGVA